MEYKPPFPNNPPKYRYLYCGMDLDKWRCVRCEDENRCYSSMPSFQSSESRLFCISYDIPEYFDKVILMSKLESTKIEMKK